MTESEIVGPSIEAQINQKLGPIPGKFIVLEGLDSYLLRLVTAECKRQNLPLVYTSEPSDTFIDAEILGLKSSGDWYAFSRYTQTKFFSTARSHHLESIIWPALREGKHVLSSRGGASTYAQNAYPSMDENLKTYCRMDEEFMYRRGGRPIVNLFFVEDLSLVYERKRIDAASQGRRVRDVPTVEMLALYQEGYYEYFLSHYAVIISSRSDEEMVNEGVEEIKRRIA